MFTQEELELLDGHPAEDPDEARPLSLGFRVSGFGFRVLGCRISGFGFGVWGLGFGV